MTEHRTAPTPVDERTYRRVADFLGRARTVVLTTHRDPDGDGLGAEAALAEALASRRVAVRVINGDPVPAQYRFLPGTAVFETYDDAMHWEVIAAADAVVLLDAARPERTGRAAPALSAAAGVTIAIDHHREGGWAQTELIDPDACATVELVHELIARLPARLTSPMAEALYTGLAADTRGFRAAHTTADAHRRAAALIAAGASPARVHEALFAAWSLGRQRLLGHFLSSLRTGHGGRLVWGVVGRALLGRFGQPTEATEGFAEEALAVAGASLAVLFLEEVGAVRLSIRARHGMRADLLARRLGGGGHPYAAGTRLAPPLAAAVRRGVREAGLALAGASPDRSEPDMRSDLARISDGGVPSGID